ncbi:MarR family transcriptional regulator [Cellulomonas carbonis]|uniref:MarR family transcriptional regulator n=1 Tax=Cellulomonas carbonis T26 TaxID=947969 RepID=A0A0A0BNZ1_9CELL|nr:MarR family transcriptional regulator [Cellulomonas carbonis]KGM10198.1 MarR family transcriptional regulator [Cellulomonas carbonis T26]
MASPTARDAGSTAGSTPAARGAASVASGPVPRDGVDRIRDQWARERPELDTEAMGIFGRVYRLARVAGDAVAAAYAEFGITRADFDVLATLRRSGEPFALSPTQLTASLMLTSGGVTGRVDRLEGLGLVRRAPSPSDRRSLVVSLTEEGRELVDRALVAGLEVQQGLLAGVAEDRRPLLDGLLRELLASADAAREGRA